MNVRIEKGGELADLKKTDLKKCDVCVVQNEKTEKENV